MIAAMITHDVFHSNNNNEELEKIVEDSKLFFSPDNDNDDDALDKITAKDLKQHLHNEALHDDGYLNHAVMVDGVREVEDRLRERELNTITITSISVSKLPLINKFQRNEPWLKVSYSTTNSWSSTVSKITDDRGTTAEWIDLNYEFVLPGIENDRGDLTVAICSQKVVLGRYVLQAKNFAKIPKIEESEYFEVKGKITNSLGKAGKIVLICRHGKSLKPLPIKNAKAEREQQVLFYPKQNPHQNFNDIDKVYVKILSIVLVDLPKVNNLDDNNPVVTVNCGTWEKKTNIEYGAGSSAKWTKLHWKLILGKLDILTFNIANGNMNGASTFIGTVGVAIDDLLPDKVGSDGIVIIIRYITDGNGITGKVRIRLQIRYPTAISNKLNEKAAAAVVEEKQRRNSTLMAPAELTRKASITVSQTATTVVVKPRILITSLPFLLTVTSITAVDLKPRHTLFANSPYVNGVFGSWGQGTDVIEGAGASASWNNLDWHVIINEEFHLQLNAWSRGLAIGGVSLSPQYLLNQPIDKDGNVTLLLKLTDENRVTSGKLKIRCNFSPDYSDYVISSNLQKMQHAMNEMVNLGLFFTAATAITELPATATIVGISVMDLINVHLARSNSPQVKVSCDRQVASTAVSVKGGAHSQWLGMQWKFDIHKGSFIILAVTSEDKLIGSLELSARAIVSMPSNDKGITEISSPITSTSGGITGRIKLSLQLSSLATHAPVNGWLTASQLSPNADPKGFFANDVNVSIQALIENKLLMLIAISNIEILDLPLKSSAMFHLHSSAVTPGQELWIAATYGRYHEATIEENVPSLVKGEIKLPAMQFNDLQWQFKIKEEFSLRLVLHNKDGHMLGLLSISPQTLFSNQTPTVDGTGFLLTETFYNENIAVGKVIITYKKVVAKDWSNNFKSMEHGPNQYRAANRAAMIGTLSRSVSTIPTNSVLQNSIQLPPIFEGDGFASLEEDEDAEELDNKDTDGYDETSEVDLEFPAIATLSKITISQFNYHYISYLIEHTTEKSTNQSSSIFPEWTRSIFGMSSSSKKSKQKLEFVSDKTHPLPEGSKISVKFEVSSSSSALVEKKNRKNRWVYETMKVQCTDDGLTVSIDEDTKIPFVCMSTDIHVTVYVMIPNAETGMMNASILGTVVMTGEDLADIPVVADATKVTRTISKGAAATANITLTLKLRSTSLQILYDDYFDAAPKSKMLQPNPFTVAPQSLPFPPQTNVISPRSTPVNESNTPTEQIDPAVSNKPQDDEQSVTSMVAVSGVSTFEVSSPTPLNKPLTAGGNRPLSAPAPISAISLPLPMETSLLSPDISVAPSIMDDNSMSSPRNTAKEIDFSKAKEITVKEAPIIISEPAENSGVVRGGKPYQFAIVTDESSIGKLFGHNMRSIEPMSRGDLKSPTPMLAHSDSDYERKQNPNDFHTVDTVDMTARPPREQLLKMLSVNDFDDNEDKNIDDSDLVSLQEYQNSLEPEVNYAEEARRRRFSDLISGTTLLHLKTNVVADKADTQAASGSKTSPRPQSRQLQAFISDSSMNEENAVLFEKIKLSGYKATVKNIMAIELASAHRLKSNCPTVHIMCGDDEFATPTLTDAGASAAWHDLDIPLIIHRDNDIALTISSRGKIIGSIVFTLKQLLKAAESNVTSLGNYKEEDSPLKLAGSGYNLNLNTPDKYNIHHDEEIAFSLSGHAKDSDLITIFGELISDDKHKKAHTGKIKMSFKLQHL